MESYALLLAATLNAGTVLALASLGLLINEKVGIVNLGAEGMMLCAAIAGFATVVHTGQDWLGFAAGMGAGALLAALFGLLVIWLNTNQIATGLALTLFGTGFSALSYLTRLPFDTLKIDRYFVRTMSANEGSAKIVSSVVKLGQDLSLEVVAEGVENAGMARLLLGIGCDYGQGFGYAPALSPQEAEVYLNESYVDGAAPLKARG